MARLRGAIRYQVTNVANSRCEGWRKVKDTLMWSVLLCDRRCWYEATAGTWVAIYADYVRRHGHVRRQAGRAGGVRPRAGDDVVSGGSSAAREVRVGRTRGG